MNDFGVGDYPNNIEIRRWAQQQPWGHKVSETGQLPKGVVVAWNRAHPDRPYVAREAHHGTTGGYENRGCRCRRCTDAASAKSNGDYHARKFEAGAS